MRAEAIFNQIPEYVCEPAKKQEEAKALIEKGYSYECEIDGVSLFKKVKTNSNPGESKSGPGEI